MKRADLRQLPMRGEELVREVQHEGERVVLERLGRPVAALVSLEDLEVLERLEDQELIRVADESESEPGPDISWERVRAESDSSE